ncbi:16S rRNA (cytidine(1402)-2'-O)-methyltransferase [Candidatus Pelagibacter sp.]|nr:16S rRNA (cytidine(1402)-2'-O)-methyltransferase [Candidatus Pelagibacter sp.]
MFDIKDNLKPGLYCVSTPIGNLGDVTLRSLHILKNSELILSEDTRITKILLSKYKINNVKLISNHKFNEKKNISIVKKLIGSKKIISIVSDAGTPALSDPGRIIINECIKEKYNIFPVPGPSAITSAISISGFSDKYYFCGFLPDKKGSIENLFDEISKYNCTIVFFISPKKINKLKALITKYFSQREIVICREMTKLFEDYVRVKVNNLENIKILEKGEITVVISQKYYTQNSLQIIEESVKKKIEKLIKIMSIKDVVSKISLENNIQKKVIYNYCLKKKNEI